MAFEGKVIDRRGSIETNNTLSDNTDIEHEYKRSIYSTILFTEFKERKLNIIDCPGSDDFCGNLFSAFKVGDVGVMVLNAQNGWEVGSELQSRYARILNKPLIGVVKPARRRQGQLRGCRRGHRGQFAREARHRAVSRESGCGLRLVHRRADDEDVPLQGR